MENIPQVPGKQAKVGQDHDARKAVLSTPGNSKLTPDGLGLQ